MDITADLTVDTVLELSRKTRELLVKHFGAGVTAPGQTWTHEPLSKACLIRGVNVKKLLADLNAHVPKRRT
jgi:hypothetical protein